ARAGARSDEAQGLFEAAGDGPGVARVLDARATSLLVEGRLRAAVATFGRAAALFQESGQLLRLGTTQAMRAFCLVLAGRAGEALAQGAGVVGLARLLIAGGSLAAADPLVAGPLPGTLMDYEARLARAELAVARGDADATATTTEALALAEEAGHLSSARQLRQLLGPLPAPATP